MRDQLLMRSRWAAVGAAIAVSLGAGAAVHLAGAASSPPSSFVSITPVRVLDTRDPVNVGLAGPFASPISQDLDVTGTIATTSGRQVVVPDGATGIVANVTAVRPAADGFISIRPADAAGAPGTSNLNFTAGSTTPNAVTVALATSGVDAGTIEITFDAYGQLGPATDVLVDIVGYYLDGGAGEPGVPGQPGTDGADAPRPARVVWVAESGGDFTNVQSALDSITDASPTNPYLVRIGPGTYPGRVTMKDWVDIEGSGPNQTTLTSEGGTVPLHDGGDSATVRAAGDLHAELRDLTVANTGADGNTWGGGIHVQNTGTALTLTNLNVTAANATFTVGIYHRNAEAPVSDVTIDTPFVGMWINSSSPTVSDVAITAGVFGVANFGFSAPTLVRATIDATEYGISNHVQVSGVVIRDSTITGDLYSVESVPEALGTGTVINSVLDGAVGNGLTCRSSYDAALDPLDASCA